MVVNVFGAFVKIDLLPRTVERVDRLGRVEFVHKRVEVLLLDVVVLFVGNVYA